MHSPAREPSIGTRRCTRFRDPGTVRTPQVNSRVLRGKRPHDFPECRLAIDDVHNQDLGVDILAKNSFNDAHHGVLAFIVGRNDDEASFSH